MDLDLVTVGIGCLVLCMAARLWSTHAPAKPATGAGPPAPQRMPVRRIVTILLPLVVLGVAYGFLQGGKDAGSAPPRPAPSGIHLVGFRETWDEAPQRWVWEPQGGPEIPGGAAAGHAR